MTRPLPLLALISLTLGGCASGPTRPASPAIDPKLKEYVDRYCGSTGNMGIGFSGRDSYNYAFSRRLEESKDAELLRLFVLGRLYGDFDRALYDFEKGTIPTGKTESRPMTPAERSAALAWLSKTLDDLAHFDVGDPHGFVSRTREELRRAAEKGE